MGMFDSLNLSILGELSDLQIALERSPAGGKARWRLLQSWLSAHKSIKASLEKCLTMEPDKATDFLFTEIAYEISGMRVTPAVIKFAAFDQYTIWRPRVEQTVSIILDCYRDRAAQDAKPAKKKRIAKGKGKGKKEGRTTGGGR